MALGETGVMLGISKDLLIVLKTQLWPLILGYLGYVCPKGKNLGKQLLFNIVCLSSEGYYHLQS